MTYLPHPNPIFWNKIRDTTAQRADMVLRAKHLSETVEHTSISILNLWRYFPNLKLKKLVWCVDHVKKHYKKNTKDICDVIIQKYHSVMIGKFRCNVSGIQQCFQAYSREYQKDIYLLGEIHISQYGCPKGSKYVNVENFIENTVLANDNKIIDFFLEVPFVEKGQMQDFSRYTQSPMMKLGAFFLSCFQAGKEECQYKNLRAHYSDIRKLTTVAELCYFLIFNYKNLHKEYDKLNLLIQTVNGQDLMEITKINKQIKNISSDYIRDFLKKEQETVLLDIKNQFDSILAHAAHPTDDVFYQHKSKKEAENTITILAKIMDLYVLGRIFRDYKDAPSAKYIIIHSGTEHTLNYYAIFQRLDFKCKVIGSESGHKSLCTDITDSLPWFEKNKRKLK